MILCGSVENVSGNNVGVVSLVYATMDKKLKWSRCIEKPGFY